MPYAFVEIEKQKKRIIRAVFAFLIGFYFLVAQILWTITKIFFVFQFASASERSFHLFSLQESIAVFLIASLVAFIHWHFSTHNMIVRILDVLGARELEPKDSYHQVLNNVIEEVSVATGGISMRGCVLPIAAMNAFAVSDFKGQAVIGVTEGLLAKLNRSQLEAVIAHEAAHIASEDSLTTTVTCSLSGVYSALLENIGKVIGRSRDSDDRGGGGRMGAYLLVIYAILWITQLINLLFNMLLSRQKEYRADAVAVRLTRNPISLAEALHVISRGWRGVGGISEALAPIFITSPDYNELEEKEGFISDLFSTHPPTKNRLAVLLDMAHCDIAGLKASIRPKEKIPAEDGVIELKEGPPKEWLVYKENKWEGPFELEALLSLNLNHDSWISRVDEKMVKYASDDQDLLQALINKSSGKPFSEKDNCPQCKVPLSEIIYEGAPILKCRHCQGIFADRDVISRILVREDFSFDPSVQHPGDAILNLYYKGILREESFKIAYKLDCPKCNEKMVRGFFSYVYPLEVDRCGICQSVWFDKGELEVLQYLSEKIRHSPAIA